MILTLTASSLIAASSATAVTRVPARCTHRTSPLLCSIRFHRDRADQLRHRMGLHHLPYRGVAERYPHRRPRLLHYWRHVHAHALKRYHAYERRLHANSWPTSWYAAAMCVHHYEGAWNANTGNGYYGGMQMDSSFESTYGPEFVAAYGTADNWPPHDQLVASYRAWRTRGWTPWPNTAAMCGLL